MENENGLTYDDRVSVNTALVAAYNALNIASDTERDTNGHIDNALHRVIDALDIVGMQPIERCAFCERHAPHICDVCGTELCNDHVYITELQFGRVGTRCTKCVRTALA